MSHDWDIPSQCPLFVCVFVYIAQLLLVAMTIGPKLSGDKIFRTFPATLLLAALGDILTYAVWIAM